MDQSTTISEILGTLQTLVSQIPILSSDLSIPSQTPNHSVLPKSITPLPSSAQHLAQSPAASKSSSSASSSSLEDVSKYLKIHVLPNLNLNSLSPNYYGFVTGGTTPAALLGDFLVSIYDQNVQVHLPAETIATNVEVAALNLLIELFNLPVEDWGIGRPATATGGTDGDGGVGTNGAGADGGGGGGGTFTTGATASNVLGLALGREYVLSRAAERRTGRVGLSCGDVGVFEMMRLAEVNRIQVLSTMPHSSIGKAASVVGIGRGNVVSVAAEGNPGILDIDLEKLEREAAGEGVCSILVVSTGEVNTGRFATNSTEKMKEVRKICDQYGVWIHVDAAFGLFGRILMGSENEQEYSEIVNGVRGVELADSITGDGHKLLNVPYDCGFFFTRHKRLSEAVFSNGNAAYLTSNIVGGVTDGIQSPLNIGIENSRRFRALPVFATLLAYGRQGYVDMLKRQISLARRITVWLLSQSDFEVLPTAPNPKRLVEQTFMIVLFRARNTDVNEGLVKRINSTGRMYVSGTSWDGQPAARIAISNWRVNVERDLKLIQETLLDVIN